VANIVYGMPWAPPPTPAPNWLGMSMFWRGWDGSEWAISDSRSGAVLLAGTRGLTLPPTSRVVDSSPARAGSRHRGSVTSEREVFWPIKIFHGDGSLDWVARDRAFRRTLDPDRPGVWTVTQPSGETRSLTLHFDNEGAQAFDTIPSLIGWAHYGLYLVAEQPYWVGDPVTRSWAADVPMPFFDPTGPQLVNISSAHKLATATLDNPGDVGSYPRWYIDGEIESATVGVDGGMGGVHIPFAIAANQCLIIETDPDVIGATLYEISPEQLALDERDRKKPSERVVGVDLISPVDMTAALGPADFQPIPAGKAVPLTLVMTGTGKIEVFLPTLWKAAW